MNKTQFEQLVGRLKDMGYTEEFQLFETHDLVLRKFGFIDSGEPKWKILYRFIKHDSEGKEMWTAKISIYVGMGKGELNFNYPHNLEDTESLADDFYDFCIKEYLM